MRYTFPQTLEDLQAVTRLIVARQTWRRPLIIALVLVGVVLILYPLLNDHPPSLRRMILDEVPWLFVISIWIAFLTGPSRLMIAVTGGLGIMILVAMTAMGHSASIGFVVMNFLPYAIMSALLALVPYFIARKYRTNPLYQGDKTVELAPEELRVVRVLSTMSFQWSGIVRAAETPDFFLIFVTKGNAVYIPKRVIPPADLPDLRAFLRAHVPSGLL